MIDTFTEETIRCLQQMATEDGAQRWALQLGKTTVADIQAHYAYLDSIGMSYSGGPVIGLIDWEVSTAGVTGLELSFNASSLLDVVVVKLRDVPYEMVRDAFKEHEAIIGEDSALPLRSTYRGTGCIVQIEADTVGESINVTFSSESFRECKREYKVA